MLHRFAGYLASIVLAENSMGDEAHPEWNAALEEVIKKEGEQAEGLYWLHNQAALWAQKRNDYIQIPSIVLATTTGFFSATSDLVPPIAIGGLSVFVGILGTINSYFKFAQKAEGHRISALWYLKTYKKIEMELSLPVAQRTSADSFLKELSEGMTRIQETAPPIPEVINSLYAKKFKDEKVARPLGTNGLDPIKIYRAPSIPKTPLTTAETPKSPIKISVLV